MWGKGRDVKGRWGPWTWSWPRQRSGGWHPRRWWSRRDKEPEIESRETNAQVWLSAKHGVDIQNMETGAHLGRQAKGTEICCSHPVSQPGLSALQLPVQLSSIFPFPPLKPYPSLRQRSPRQPIPSSFPAIQTALQRATKFSFYSVNHKSLYDLVPAHPSHVIIL